ncbi:MAG TPA: DUF411 domain-containing protein [Sphingomicrobium sp.]|nr:DUF411 domain-containing protein [Sphingomicrobium sp.]
MMLRRNLFRMVAPLALLVSAQSAVAATLLVTKTAFCGCCKAWVERMKAAGFTVVVKDVADITPTARKLGVPDDLRSCHTSQIGVYAIEGHVPAADIKRLLAQRPKAAGIAVPGMVMGTPGMEHGDHKMPYEVILFDRNGKTKVFAVH